MHFDWTISLGTLVHLVFLLAALGGLWAKLKSRIDSFEVEFKTVDKRLDHVETDLVKVEDALVIQSGLLQNVMGQLTIFMKKMND